MIRRPLCLSTLILLFCGCDAEPEDSAFRRGDAGPHTGAGADPETDPRTPEDGAACALFLEELLDDLRDSPGAPSWAYSDVTDGGVIGLAGGSVGVGNGGATSIGDLPRTCASIEAELGLPEGYLQPAIESIPGGYVEGCGCTDCGLDPETPGLDAFDDIGLGHAAVPHEIYNAAQLTDLAQSASAWSRDFIQCGDIDLHPYYAAGGDEFNIATAEQAFSGVYDGGNHAIDGFATQSRGGLFEALQGTVRSLALRGPTVAAEDDHGALVNTADGAELLGIEVVDAYFDTLPALANVGAVAGVLRDTNASEIDVVDPVFEGIGQSTQVGGLVGRLEHSTLTDAVVSDPQIQVRLARAGGLVAESLWSTVADAWVDGGLASGTAAGGAAFWIRASTFSNVETSAEVQAATAGGFASALMQWSSEPESSTISDCLAEGDISPGGSLQWTSPGDMGGFLGWAHGGTIERSASTGDVDYRSSATGTFEVSMGGFIGTIWANHNLQISDAFALGNVDRALGSTGEDEVGGFVGMIRAPVQSTSSVSIERSFAAGNPEGVTTGSFVGVVDLDGVEIHESFAIGHHTGLGGCFVGEGSINTNGNNYVADTPCPCVVEPGVGTAPLADFDDPNANLGFSWPIDVWAFEAGSLPELQ